MDYVMVNFFWAAFRVHILTVEENEKLGYSLRLNHLAVEQASTLSFSCPSPLFARSLSECQAPRTPTAES